MNWFKRNKHANNNTQELMEETINPNMEKFEKIFLDENEPGTQVAKSESLKHEDSLRPVKSAIDRFIELDHFAYGYRDGYNYQSTEMMNQKLDEIRCSFDLILENEVQRIAEKRTMFRIQQIRCSDEAMEELRGSLQIKIDELNDSISNLKIQLDLCKAFDGWVSKCTSLYRNGFIRGVQDYHETELFKNNIGLLNQ